MLQAVACDLFDADDCNSSVSLGGSADSVVEPEACSSSARLGAGAGAMTVVAFVIK